MSRWLVLISMMAGLWALDCLAQQTLQYKWTAGQRYQVTVTMSQIQQMDMTAMGGAKMEIKIHLVSYTTRNVDAVDAEGVATVSDKVTRMVMKMNNPMQGEFTIDTDQEDDGSNPMSAMVAPQVRALVGNTTTYRIDRRGEILEVSKAADNQLAGNMKQMMRQNSLVLPEQPLVVGDHWKSSFDVNQGPMILNNEITYTYKGAGDVAGTHRFTTQHLLQSKADPANPMPGAEVKTKESSGELIFDEARGQLTSSTMKSVLEMNMQGMPVITTIDAKMEFKEQSGAAVTEPSREGDDRSGGERKSY